jgi:uncharacterized protein (TIGR02996 family)
MLAVIGTTRSALMVEQLDAILEHWPADPRVTRPFIQLLRKPPFTSSATQSAWRRLFKLLQQTADPRTITELRVLDFHTLLREVNSWRAGGVDDNAHAASFFSDRAKATVAALEKKYANGLPRVEDTASLERLETLVRSESETALLQQIQSNPADPAAREVLTDHLLERDDVRGQFLALQQARAQGKLTPDLEKQERALHDQYALQWVAPLVPVLDEKRLVFENGFLAECAVDPDRQAVVKELTGHPLWATVRRIEIWGESFPREFLRHPGMKSLNEVTNIHTGNARALLSGDETWDWEAVGLDLPHYDSVGDDVALLERNVLRVFPKLRRLQVDGYSIQPETGRWLAKPAFQHLEEISIAGGAASNIPKWLEVLPRTRLRFFFRWLQGYEFSLDASRTELEVVSRRVQGWTTVTLVNLAESAAPLTGQLKRIHLRSRATKADRAAFQALLADGGELVTA